MDKKRNKLGHFVKGHSTNIGRSCSQETRLKISASNIGKGRGKGWRHSEETKEKIRRSKIGSRNPMWVSENPSYDSIHLWLARNFEKTACEHCGSHRFVEFALRKGSIHDHFRENYLCLCSSCHKRYDYTEERKAKLSNSLKGRKITWADKISKANTGMKKLPEARKKMSIWHKNNLNERDKTSGKFIRKTE